MTFIGDYAFAFCAGLSSVALPETLRVIGDYAFGGSTEFQLPVEPGSCAQRWTARGGYLEGETA